MQVYRGMDIGTAKATPGERNRVAHHLVDLVEPETVFTVADFQQAGRRVLAGAEASGTRMLIVGGSGLHFRALVDPMEFPPSDPGLRSRLEALEPEAARERLLAADPDAAAWVALANPRRVVRALEVLELTGRTPSQRAADPGSVAVRAYQPLHPVVALGVDPGEALGERVRQRFAGMLAAGLLKEVTRLAPRLGPTASQGVGYRELLRVVSGEWELDVAVSRAIGATIDLARRQRTFHRRDPRIKWLQWDDEPGAMASAAATQLEEAGWTS